MGLFKSSRAGGGLPADGSKQLVGEDGGAAREPGRHEGIRGFEGFRLGEEGPDPLEIGPLLRTERATHDGGNISAG